MRAYVLVHSALSGIQKGIQAGHALLRLGRYKHPLFSEWIQKHETMIVLEGGFHADLGDAASALSGALGGEFDSPRLPWMLFEEDEETMAKMTTALAVIVPERIYDAEPDSNDHDWYPSLENWEAVVARLMAGRPLAR